MYCKYSFFAFGLFKGVTGGGSVPGGTPPRVGRSDRQAVGVCGQAVKRSSGRRVFLFGRSVGGRLVWPACSPVVK